MAQHTDELCNLFFKELKKYNSTNFKALLELDLQNDTQDTKVYKSFSSVVTRFFIFKEKHPELTINDTRLLYFCLGIDMIAGYFSQYPMGDIGQLQPFQSKLEIYNNKFDKGE